MFLLVPSPLLGPATWAPVAALLPDARVVGVDEVESAAAGHPDMVLVPHSNAGLRAPGWASRLPGSRVVYVDAALPRAEGETALAPPLFREWLARLADDAGLLPPWTEWWDDVDALFPDAATRAAVEAEQPRLPVSWFDRTVEVPSGWHRQPSAYLAFGDTYADELSIARAHGWPTRVLAGGHLHQLHDPAGVAAAIEELAASLG